MLGAEQVNSIVKNYKNVVVATIGSHSALDICEGAKEEKLGNVVVCQKGREKTYLRHMVRKLFGKEVGVIDTVLFVDKFSQMVQLSSQLQKLNAVFVPNRSFEVYVGYENIENSFEVPIFGNRRILRAEERTEPRNQYYLLEKAGIRTPKRLKDPGKISSLCIVKAPEARRGYERAFFFVSSFEEYERKSKEMLSKGIINKEGLKGAVIEEFSLGAQFNFNFFHSPLSGETELLGVDTRRQTNLDGLLRLPAKEQLEMQSLKLKTIEVGHVACTLRESLLERVFEIGDSFVETCRKEYAPGIIGPFALQGVIEPNEDGEEPVIFDVSLRVPGSPGISYTPYTKYFHRENISTGRRIAMELKQAMKERRLSEVVT